MFCYLVLIYGLGATSRVTGVEKFFNGSHVNFFREHVTSHKPTVPLTPYYISLEPNFGSILSKRRVSPAKRLLDHALTNNMHSAKTIKTAFVCLIYVNAPLTHSPTPVIIIAEAAASAAAAAATSG